MIEGEASRNEGMTYILERSTPLPNIQCWLWNQSLGSHGYGNACFPTGRATVAHRVSFESFKSPIPAGMLVQHSCDNKWCVNPDHLSLGTDATNATDKTLKGRAAKKIPYPQRVVIVAAFQSGEISKAQLAQAYAVDSKAISQIIKKGH